MNYLLTDMCIAMELGPMFSPTYASLSLCIVGIIIRPWPRWPRNGGSILVGEEAFLYSKSIQTSSGTHLTTYAIGN